MSAPDANGAAAGNVLVTFFTTTYPLQMPEQAFSIPITTLPEGLAVLVHSVLGTEDNTPFDFLINDEYVSTSLERFLRRRSLSIEKIVQIEYTPAIQAQEGSKLPHDDWVSCVRAPFYGNSSILVTAAYDHCVRLWSGEDCLAIGSAHKEAAKALAIHPVAPTAGSSKPADSISRKKKKDADVGSFDFASGGKDGKVCAWRYDATNSKMELLGAVHQHVEAVDSIDISPDGALLCSASWDCSVKVFEWSSILDQSIAPEKKAPVAAFTDHARAVLSCRFSPSRPELLYSAGLDGSIKTWDVRHAQLGATLKGEHAILSMSCKPTASGGDAIIAGHTDNRIRLFDARTKAAVKTFAGHRQWVYSVAWLWRKEEPNTLNDHFVSASEDGTLRVWDLRCSSNALVVLDRLHTDGVLDVTYAGNSEVASGGKDNKTKTFTLSRDGKRVTVK